MIRNSNNNDSNKKQLDCNVIYFLMIILTSVWMICYFGEQKLPQRRIQDTLQRLMARNISQQDIQIAKQILNNLPDNQAQNTQSRNLILKYGTIQGNQKQFCILVNHKNTNEKWFASLYSIFNQNYNLYKVIYFNNKRGAYQIQKYIQQNAQENWKFQSIDPIVNYTQINMLQIAKNKCQHSDFVLMMDDDNILIGKQILNLLNNQFKKQTKVQFVYGATLKQANNQIILGNSYEYPKTIVTEKKFLNYPYIISGPIAFKRQLLQKINLNNMKNKQGTPYKKVLQVAIGLQLIRKSSGNVRFISQVLTFVEKQNTYLSLDREINAQLTQVFNKKQ